MNEVPLHVDPDLRLYVRELETKVEELERGIANSAIWQEEVRMAIVDRLAPDDRPHPLPPTFAACIHRIADMREEARDQRDRAHRDSAYAVASVPSRRPDVADYGRVMAWARDPNRRPAYSAFTAGAERQAAYWIENTETLLGRQLNENVPRVEKQQPPLIDPQDVFQWTGDLEAFTAWFGESMPIDLGGQISVPVYRTASGKWNGRWLRVWCGSWIVRREDGNGEGKRHYTFPDDEFRLFIQPNVGVAAPEEAR